MQGSSFLRVPARFNCIPEILAHDKSTLFGSILASDCVRVRSWNASNAEAGDLWFRGQFLEIKRERDKLIEPVLFP